MHRSLIVTTVAAAALVAAAPAAATAPLPAIFAKQIKKINAAPRAPNVLLPDTMSFGAKHVYPSGGPSGASYALELAAAPHCGGANACFVASFTARKGGKVFGRRVTIRGASSAGYLPESCGASCSPSQVDFIVDGVLYTIQTNVKKSKLISAAEAAISAGPRQ
jgi:hypothetical protein